MPRHIAEDDDWEDESADWDADEDDSDVSHEDEDDPTDTCPYCRRPIHDDAQRCPHCEKYISQEDAPPARKAWWIGLGAVISLYIVYRWIVG